MVDVVFKAHRLLPHDVRVVAQCGETLQEVAVRSRLPMGDACGGQGACSSCHCHVVQGNEHLTELSDREDTALDKASDVRLTSRLGCQARIADAQGVIEVVVTDENLLAYEREHRGT